MQVLIVIASNYKVLFNLTSFHTNKFCNVTKIGMYASLKNVHCKLSEIPWYEN